MRIPISATVCGKLLRRSQPRASGANVRLACVGSGGRCAPRTQTVRMHQAIITTTITVVTYMIRSAFPLDSGIPLMFSHQK